MHFAATINFENFFSRCVYCHFKIKYSNSDAMLPPLNFILDVEVTFFSLNQFLVQFPKWP